MRSPRTPDTRATGNGGDIDDEHIDDEHIDDERIDDDDLEVRGGR